MSDQARFEQILESARARTSIQGLDTLVVHAHLAQMRLFMQKGGVEWVPRQDSFGQRTDFIRRVVEYNQLPGRLDGIIDSHLIDGRGLLYFRPSKDLYRIHYFTKDQYRTFYDEEGDIEELQIIYSYTVRSGYGGSDIVSSDRAARILSIDSPNAELRWIKITVRMDTIVQVQSPARPAFGVESSIGGRSEAFTNTLGFIPAVEVFNNRGLQAGSGRGEFDWLAGAILQHDRMLRNIRNNLNFFGGPTLVSSRPRHDLVEQDGEGGSGRATIASNSGFIGLNRASTRTADPSPSATGAGLRVPRIIANVEAADRVAYITPDSVGGDLVQHAQMYQEMIRSALGGVDDLSISSGATAYEVRTLYGRVAATAKRKCRELYEYGFCKLFSLMIMHEETLFRESLGQALNIAKPEPVLPEALPAPAAPGGATSAPGGAQQGEKQLQLAQQQYDTAMIAWRQRIGDAVNQIKDSGQIPPDVIGLLPDGTTVIDWRWMGEIFDDSAQEILQQSIVCRNLQELGVSSIESLRHLFPYKTPEERAAMLSGYPFRMVEATQRSVGIFSDLVRSMFQVPHPQQPDLPLAADPSLDLVPYLYRTLSYLRQELSYSGNYHDVDPASNPPVLSDADRLRASRGEPTERDRELAERRARASSYLASSWPPGGPGGMAAGVQPARRPDADAQLPGLGGTLAFDPERPYPGAADQLGLASAMGGPGFASAMGGPMGPYGAGPYGAGFGNADLAAPSNAGLAFGGPGQQLDSTGRQPGRNANPRATARSTTAGSRAASSRTAGSTAAGSTAAGSTAAGKR